MLKSPIPDYRNCHIEPCYMGGWQWWHDDYDGAPDANDNRYGHEASYEACRESIDERFDEPSEMRELGRIARHYGPRVAHPVLSFCAAAGFVGALWAVSAGLAS